MAATRIYDRIPSFMGGTDAYRYAAELDINQSQLVQNFVVMDNGRAVTRPGADQINSAANSWANIAPTGPVQGMAFLDNLAHGQLLLVGEGGKLYSWSGAAWSASLAFTLTSASSQFCAVQGVDHLMVSDGAKAMQFWDGNTFTPCSTGLADTSETHGPTGATCLSFIAGMFVASGPAMVQGTGSDVQHFPADALIFSNFLAAPVTEGETPDVWDNATQSIRVGNGDGEAIVGHVPIQSTAAAWPIYNLCVFKENSVWILGIQPGAYASYTAMFAALSVTPQGDQIGTGIGCVGSRAFCQYQNDILFMSQDGVQSLQRMQAAAGQYQLSLPLSTPIQPYIDRINWGMAYNIQAIKYRQYAIFFVPLDNSPTNNYALVWNGRIGKWLIWTGWNTEFAIVTRFGREIQLVLGESGGEVNQWKDAQELFGLDNTYKDNGTPIAQLLNTRAMVFGSLDFQKKLRAAVIRFNQGNAVVNLAAYLDLADSDDWSQEVTGGGAVLPVILPFVLASVKPTPCYRSLEGLPYCNEFYLSISANSGWLDIRGIVAAAFQKAMRDPNA